MTQSERNRVVLSFDAFVVRFAAEFDMPVEGLKSSTLLFGELGFDSLEFLRASIFLDSLAPFDVPPDLDHEAITLDDLYRFYCLNATTPDSEA